MSRAYTVNGLNQYTSTGTATLDYDGNGNLKSDGSTSFVYDSENRLVSASGAKTASLAYDPLGRLWQTSGGTAGVTRFVYDGDRLAIEYDGSGNVLRSYVHGPGADEPIAWYEGPAGYDRRFLKADHQSSIVAIAGSNGNAIAINAYDPWGVPNAGNTGRFGYTGQTWIPELGLWYYKARFYSARLGRFLQVDPVGYKDQMNLYAYVGNDPVNGTDPTGMTLSLTGEDPIKKRYIDQAYRLTGVRVRQGADGNLEQVGKRDPKIGSSEAASSLIRTINSKTEVNINLVSADSRITGDLLSENKVDIGDFETFETASSRLAASLFTHVLEEFSYFAASKKEFFDYFDAHHAGLRAEADMMGAAYRSNPQTSDFIIFQLS